MNGGDPGSRGVNSLSIIRSGDQGTRIISLGGKNTINVHPGDILTILTPGGGGYGPHISDGTGSRSCRTQDLLEISDKSKVVYLKSAGSLNQYTLNQESV